MFGCMLAAAHTLSGLSVRTDRFSRTTITLGAGVLAVLFHASRAQLRLGQSDFLILLLMALTLAASARGQDGRAGVWLALATALKPTVGFLVLWFLWKRAYRAAAAFGALSAVLFVVPLAVFGPGLLVDFIGAAQYFSGPVFAVTPINQSPYGLLLRMFTVNPFTVPIVDAPLLADIVRYTIAAAMLFTLTRTVSRSRSVSVTQLALEYGLFTTAMLVVGPLSEDIHYVYLLIPIAATAAALVAKFKLSRMPIALGAGLIATYAYLSVPGMVDLMFAFDTRVPSLIGAPALLLTGVMVYALGTLVLLVLLTLRWNREADSPLPVGAEPSSTQAVVAL
jgi:hypothetical protein